MITNLNGVFVILPSPIQSTNGSNPCPTLCYMSSGVDKGHVLSTFARSCSSDWCESGELSGWGRRSRLELQTQPSTLGPLAFSVTGPSLWNSLPETFAEPPRTAAWTHGRTGPPGSLTGGPVGLPSGWASTSKCWSGSNGLTQFPGEMYEKREEREGSEVQSHKRQREGGYCGTGEGPQGP